MQNRILICGDRNWKNRGFIWRVLRPLVNPYSPPTIIHGGAAGADVLGAMVAGNLGCEIVCFPAEWNKLGKPAGPIRNQRMIDEGKPDLVLAFHNEISKSKGTKDMICRANKHGLEVRLYTENEPFFSGGNDQ